VHHTIDQHLSRLHEAHDSRSCEAAVNEVRSSLAHDQAYSDQDLLDELRARNTAGTGPMPYPSPDTACAIFGIQTALRGALEDRGAKP
jgi:hypothetical protein